MDNTKKIEQDQKHKCHIYQRVFKIQSQLISHEKIVHGSNKKHKCNLCGKSFSSLADWKRHIKGVHNCEKYHKLY